MINSIFKLFYNMKWLFSILRNIEAIMVQWHCIETPYRSTWIRITAMHLGFREWKHRHESVVWRYAFFLITKNLTFVRDDTYQNHFFWFFLHVTNYWKTTWLGARVIYNPQVENHSRSISKCVSLLNWMFYHLG